MTLSILALPDSNLRFEIEADAFGFGIVLIQAKMLILSPPLLLFVYPSCTLSFVSLFFNINNSETRIPFLRKLGKETYCLF